MYGLRLHIDEAEWKAEGRVDVDSKIYTERTVTTSITPTEVNQGVR